MTASTAAEPFAPGDWVVVGENATNTPHGVARVTTITENGSLIVAVGHMQHKHVVGARYCQRHAGPPPGREPAEPPARPPLVRPRPTPIQSSPGACRKCRRPHAIRLPLR